MFIPTIHVMEQLRLWKCVKKPLDWGFGFFNYERYTSEIKSAQESFKDKIVIRKGVEVDYQHVFEEETSPLKMFARTRQGR
jgi:histidinol phosphatase-like PHP family hydrolase